MDHLVEKLPPSAGDDVRFRFPDITRGGPEVLLSLRRSGDMRYRHAEHNPNRDAFFRARGIDPDAVLGLELKHGRRVLAPEAAREHLPFARRAALDGGADGMILPPGTGLWASITVADCMPIWILDRSSGAYGVLHSGWKGTGILETAARLFESRYGSRPCDLAAIFGPSIGACCYAVPPDRARSFAAEFGESAAPVLGGTQRIDLRAANLSLARRLGIGTVLSIEACTCCDERLGSFRREGSASFTRMVAAIGETAEAGI
jgi:copper oxidase (laccase) domain-containing protein